MAYPETHLHLQSWAGLEEILPEHLPTLLRLSEPSLDSDTFPERWGDALPSKHLGPLRFKKISALAREQIQAEVVYQQQHVVHTVQSSA